MNFKKDLILLEMEISTNPESQKSRLRLTLSLLKLTNGVMR